MQLFHLGSSRFARQLSGEGARLFGGRWNMKGDACIYTSGTRSLCVLEYAANVFHDAMPPELSFTEYSLPDHLCRFFSQKELPADWNTISPTSSTKQFGSALLADENCVCFAVPSSIIPAEMNFVLNPSASAFKQLKIVAVERFIFDSRIKK